MLSTESVLPPADDGTVQVIYYDVRRVGEKLDYFKGWMLGDGLLQNLAKAYRFILFKYTPGDEIHAFAFRPTVLHHSHHEAWRGFTPGAERDETRWRRTELSTRFRALAALYPAAYGWNTESRAAPNPPASQARNGDASAAQNGQVHTEPPLLEM